MIRRFLEGLRPAAGGRGADRAATRTYALRGEAESLAAKLPPLLAEAERVAMTVSQGIHGRRRAGPGESFWQFRHYAQSDPASSIDWRQSAKTNDLFVRENEWEAALSVIIWRDSSPSMRYASKSDLPQKEDRAGLLALALAMLLARAGERVGAADAPFAPTIGTTAIDRLARHWATNTDSETLPDTSQIKRFAHVVLFSDFLMPQDELMPWLRTLAARDVKAHLVQVFDPAEEDLPFTGRTLFEGLEGDDEMLVGKAEALKLDYKTRLDDLRRHMREMAKRLGWTFAVHHTTAKPHSALLALYRVLAAGGSSRAHR